MSHVGFDMLSSGAEGYHFEQIRLDEMITKQEERLTKVMEKLGDFLEKQDGDHRKTHRANSLARPFAAVGGYPWEKIGEGSQGYLGLAAIKQIRTALSEFVKLLAERGLALATYTPVEYHVQRLEYAMEELTAFFEGRPPGRVVDDDSVDVYCRYAHSHFQQLESIAKEIDEEYAE